MGFLQIELQAGHSEIIGSLALDLRPQHRPIIARPFLLCHLSVFLFSRFRSRHILTDLVAQSAIFESLRFCASVPQDLLLLLLGHPHHPELMPDFESIFHYFLKT